MWVEPRSAMFTVGKKTFVNLYIHNLCPYPDNFNLTYINGNPNLIKVDITGFEHINDFNPKEIRVVYPSITLLEAHAIGTITFNATSEGNNTIQRNANLTVLSSDFPMSLPEFNSLSILGIIFLIGIVYFVVCTKIKKC
jgi:hypothetical protein